MKYNLNEISNRDCCLLYLYRILRQPSFWLSAIYTDMEPKVCQILTGELTESVYKGQVLYEYKLDVEITENRVPYLEFESEQENTLRSLAEFIYYDTETNALYSTLRTTEFPVTIKVYEVVTIADITEALYAFNNALTEFNSSIDAIKAKLSAISPEAAVINGRDHNLLQFVKVEGNVGLMDTGYTLTHGLKPIELINPTPELLAKLPKYLTNDIILNVTNGFSYVLSGFIGHTIYISGNGNVTCRDVKSTIQVYNATNSNLYFMNCSLVNFKHKKNMIANIDCNKVTLINTSAVGIDGNIRDLTLLNSSTCVAATTTITNIAYIGVGCTVSCTANVPSFRFDNILGNLYLYSYNGKELIIMNGKTIGFNYNNHDFPVYPLHIEEMDEGYIHIREGGSE